MKNSKLQFKIQKLKNIYHLFQAIIANIYYGFPSRRLKVIGVTGTDGKTTTIHLIYHILKFAGYKASMISSVYAIVGNKEYDTGFHVTTPSSFFIQKMLKTSVDHEDKYFVLETTSHALDQNRVWGIRYEIGVITNITHEHLDYHKTYEKYVMTKVKLLKMARISIVNKDDESYKEVKSEKLKVKSYNSKLKIIKDLNKEFKEEKKKYLKMMDGYRFSQALGLIYEFLWHRFADYYIEQLKGEVINGNIEALESLKEVYLENLKMLHPFAPFVTEAGWKVFNKENSSILLERLKG